VCCLRQYFKQLVKRFIPRRPQPQYAGLGVKLAVFGLKAALPKVTAASKNRSTGVVTVMARGVTRDLATAPAHAIALC
jgi:hypothetical protein